MGPKVSPKLDSEERVLPALVPIFIFMELSTFWQMVCPSPRTTSSLNNGSRSSSGTREAEMSSQQQSEVASRIIVTTIQMIVVQRLLLRDCCLTSSSDIPSATPDLSDCGLRQSQQLWELTTAMEVLQVK